MTPRAFLLLAVLACPPAMGAIAHGEAPAGGPGPSSPGRLTVDGVPDTGQFLPDTAMLGIVNGRPIRVSEFVESYFNAYAPDRPATDNAGRVEWLTSIVNKEILAHVARRVN